MCPGRPIFISASSHLTGLTEAKNYPFPNSETWSVSWEAKMHSYMLAPYQLDRG